jgi:hypothetical protein
VISVALIEDNRLVREGISILLNQMTDLRVVAAASSGDTIDFDVFLEQQPRRHVGQLVGETISGTWLRLAGDGASVSGTFTAHRLSQ